ncbi:alkaline-phosphatase-like protein [Phakopsora pachyrhizi]|uniref:GPI ethanolamine phosphate transferase 2 n=1 Tax=Phakopsora pachyrhizi TaxID=170000 RepID=A0AAV0AK41_PHAPC|nr:alkaline-phosphatase-like protein [Phakopsora pachyrhizi]CAH7667168.1 alkaline-phosphatase-like protein [Phakopsora pachyrhizi]
MAKGSRDRFWVDAQVLGILLSQFAAALLFAYGFFPVFKPPGGFSPPVGGVDDPPLFDRLVFVLIDALRSDFMFGQHSHMNFTKSLVREGRALPFTALAQSPTVTLPRLKAITTGANPQFLDAVMNIAEISDGSAILESSDSWLRQILFTSSNRSHVETGKPVKKALFFGDDTWLRLFPPSWFVETDGVSSFYVKDTEIVDYNVTRHLKRIFSNKNSQTWDLVLLHYLGLDHVGHLSGAKSVLMGPKQRQMDEVISQIFHSISTQDSISGQKSLLVIAGDHGMTDAGNHGGSSADEVRAALLFAAPSFFAPKLHEHEEIKPEIVQQVDIAPTLAALFGAGIPSASIGVAIGSIIKLSCQCQEKSTFNDTYLHKVFRENAFQMASLLQKAGRNSPALGILQENLSELTETTVRDAIDKLDPENLKLFLLKAQDHLLLQFSGAHNPTMLLGLILLALTAIAIFWKTIKVLTVSNLAYCDWQSLIAIVFTVVQLSSFGSTSFIEEEHEAWFFLTSSFLLIKAIFSPPKNRFEYFMVCMIVRVFRGWSFNGQKEATNSSLSFQLRGQTSFFHLLDLLGIYLFVTTWPLFKKLDLHNMAFFVCISSASILTLTPMDGPLFYFAEDFLFGKLTYRPLTIYIILTLSATFMLKESNRVKFLSKLQLIFFVLLRSLTRLENYPVLWLSLAVSKILSTIQDENNVSKGLECKARHGKVLKTYDHISSAWLQVALCKCAFFAFGGSNSLATVDLSNSYNGLKSYSIPSVTLLTFLSNFAGPITISLGFILRNEYLSNKESVTLDVLFKSTYFSVYLLMICLLGAHFTEHLFVYTVFSPAVLYCFGWCFGFHYLMTFFEIFMSWI